MNARNHAIVIGSGPNGLAAAIRLAEEGRHVVVLEAAESPGGGCRSAELTLPGFTHDPCAAVVPLAAASPFFQRLDLGSYGLEWVRPAIELAHPLDDGRAVLLFRSIDQTAAGLRTDGAAYHGLMQSLLAASDALIADLLAPPGQQIHPIATARFGQHAVRSAAGFASSWFHGDEARALLAGNAAHSLLPLEAPLTAGYALFLILLGHVVGWPFARRGSGEIPRALIRRLQLLGGEVRLGQRVRELSDVPLNGMVFFDTNPQQVASIARSRLPERFRRALRRHRVGPGVFKIDYALSGPVPWTAVECHSAGTLHLGGTFEEIARSERDVAQLRHPERPFIIACQPSLFDPSRAPAGCHTFWAYCHVPAGSDVDMTERIERQIERFAPGFRDLVLARHVMRPGDLERYNPNDVGGSINGGIQDVRTYARWTFARHSAYATPDPALFLCSAATPPGGGVHGMCGVNAVAAALRRERSRFPRRV